MLINKKRRKQFFWVVLSLCLLVGSGQMIARANHPEAGALVLNEFLASNGGGLTDEDGDSSDWIEIYNRSASPVNLAGWALTDDPEQPQKWMFPDMTLGAGDYLIIFASGKNHVGADTLHTNFKLSKDEGFLALYNLLDGRFVDEFVPQYPEQFRNVSYGLYSDGMTYGYLGRPTPGAPNIETETMVDIVSPVSFSSPRGYYQGPIALRLSTDTPEATIHYTTDGTTPRRGRVWFIRTPLPSMPPPPSGPWLSNRTTAPQQ
jgi:hypothetical protein